MDDAAMRERIGARIAQARKAQGLTQRDFAELLGVTVRSLQHYEAGRIVPYRHFPRMEAVTSKRPGWFLQSEHEGYASVTALTALRDQLTTHLELLETRLRTLSENVERLRELRESAEDRRRAEPRRAPANRRRAKR
jgi:transcriptional regulator with XRE-family HTH domain